MGTFVVEALAGEHQSRDVEGLAEPSRELGRGALTDAEHAELVGHRAPPDAEVEAAAAHDVDRRGHLRQQRGWAERVTGGEVADADRRRARRERGRERPALEGVVILRGRRREVVHQPDRVEAGGLGRERALEHRRERHPHLGQEQPEPGGRA